MHRSDPVAAAEDLFLSKRDTDQGSDGAKAAGIDLSEGTAGIGLGVVSTERGSGTGAHLVRVTVAVVADGPRMGVIATTIDVGEFASAEEVAKASAFTLDRLRAIAMEHPDVATRYEFLIEHVPDSLRF